MRNILAHSPSKERRHVSAAVKMIFSAPDRAEADGEQIKPVARELGLSPNTVRKYLKQDGPPQSVILVRPRLLDPYQTHIDQLIRSTPRITAKRVGSYLRQNVDSDLAIGERALRVYVAQSTTDARSERSVHQGFIPAGSTIAV